MIGKAGTLTAEEAWDAARAQLVDVAKGIDPSADRHAERNVQTVAQLCDLCLEAARAGLVMTRFKKPKRESTIDIDVSRIERHIKPNIGRVLVTDLTRRKIQKMVDSITAGEEKAFGSFKTGKRGLARVTGGAGTAARVAELLGGIWTWAESRDHVSGPYPGRKLQAIGREAKDRTLTPRELVALGKT